MARKAAHLTVKRLFYFSDTKTLLTEKDLTHTEKTKIFAKLSLRLINEVLAKEGYRAE